MHTLLIRPGPTRQPVHAAIACIDRLLANYAKAIQAPVSEVGPLSEVGRLVLAEHIDRALDERLRLMARAD